MSVSPEDEAFNEISRANPKAACLSKRIISFLEIGNAETVMAITTVIGEPVRTADSRMLATLFCDKCSVVAPMLYDEQSKSIDGIKDPEDVCQYPDPVEQARRIEIEKSLRSDGIFKLHVVLPVVRDDLV